MRRILVIPVLVGACASGVGVDVDVDRGGSEGDGEPLVLTTQGERVPGAARTLFDAVDASVHELITCGNAQRQLGATLVLDVATANGAMFDPEALDLLTTFFGFGDGSAVRRGDGDWSFDMGGGSAFDVRFLDPVKGGVIVEDPTRLDTYVRGVAGSADLTFDEIEADPEAPVTFTYTWEEPGPLGHLIDPLTSPIVYQAVPYELIGWLGWSYPAPDLGPFTPIGGIGLEGTLHLQDRVAGVEVAYDATIRAERLDAFLGGTASAIDVEALEGEVEGWKLTAENVDIAYVPSGLTGSLGYAITAPDGAIWRVVSDFGQGAAYPESRWSR